MAGINWSLYRTAAASGRQDSNLRPLVPQTSASAMESIRVQNVRNGGELVGKITRAREMESDGIASRRGADVGHIRCRRT
jgi:hypothetical protein